MTQPPPDIPANLRLARRTLEEIPGVSVLTDWTFDWARFWRLEVELTPDHLGSENAVPATTRWFVRAQDDYPKGIIDILPAVHSGLPGIYAHQLPFTTREGAPYRGAKICVATDSEGNLRRQGDVEPRTAEDRLAWQITRALGWIAQASNGTLLASGDPFELPVYKVMGPPLFAFREGPADLAFWSSIDDRVGIADLRRLDNSGDETWIVIAFRSLSRQLLFEPDWGIRIKSMQTHARTAIWLRVPRLVVRQPYEAPSTWGELADAFAEQGASLFEGLQRGTAGLHDGATHPLLIGFPVPERIGDPMHQMHWLTIELPTLERQAPDGFRVNDIGLWMASSGGTFHPASKLEWVVSENWHPDELANRGRLNAALTAKKILLIGAGALGSAVAELLVRAGVAHLEVVDDQRLKAGNLVRHTLTLSDLGDWKANALARRLNAASPNVSVAARPSSLDQLSGEDLGSFDVVIETTGDRRVLQTMSEVEAPRPTAYASLSVSLHSRRLFAYVANDTRFPLAEFDTAYAPFSRTDVDWAEELPMEGVGCWHPVFPTRADELWLMASAAVSLLNDTPLAGHSFSRLHVIQRTVDSRGCFTGLESIAL